MKKKLQLMLFGLVASGLAFAEPPSGEFAPPVNKERSVTEKGWRSDLDYDEPIVKSDGHDCDAPDHDDAEHQAPVVQSMVSTFTVADVLEMSEMMRGSVIEIHGYLSQRCKKRGKNCDFSISDGRQGRQLLMRADSAIDMPAFVSRNKKKKIVVRGELTRAGKSYFLKINQLKNQ